MYFFLVQSVQVLYSYVVQQGGVVEFCEEGKIFVYKLGERQGQQQLDYVSKR